MIVSELPTDLRLPCTPSRDPASAVLAHPLTMGSLRSSAQAHDLGHLATESLAANRNQSSRSWIGPPVRRSCPGWLASHSESAALPRQMAPARLWSRQPRKPRERGRRNRLVGLRGLSLAATRRHTIP